MSRKRVFQAACWAALVCAAWVPVAQATPITFDYSGSSTLWTVPTSGIYQIVAYGAQGGGQYSDGIGGHGAEIGGSFTLTAGESLFIAVGGVGRVGFGAGGGGGSFVALSSGLTYTPLVIAGGGAGDANYGHGGAGRTDSGSGNGGNGGAANYGFPGGGGGGGFLGSGGKGGNGNSDPGGQGGGGFPGLSGGGSGGFGGGGGGAFGGGGGGGGYSGGDGGNGTGGGGNPGNGGGSYLAPSATDLIAVAGYQSGNGQVTIDSPAPVPEPATTSLFGVGALALFAVRRQGKKAKPA